jgi:hypothetical protein
VYPLPPISGGRGTLADEVPIPTRGHTLWYSLLYVLCGSQDIAAAPCDAKASIFVADLKRKKSFQKGLSFLWFFHRFFSSGIWFYKRKKPAITLFK